MKPAIRYLFYDLFFSVFVREPTDETIQAWRRGVSAVRAADPGDPIAEAADDILANVDGAHSGEKIRAEYARLFTSPLGPAISLCGSRYVDGRPFGPYLVRLRTFLEKTPFRKQNDYSEPEDSLPFHLDLMRSFIQEEERAAEPGERETWRARQQELLNDYLLTWLDMFVAEFGKLDSPAFYGRAASLLQRFLHADRQFLLSQSNP